MRTPDPADACHRTRGADDAAPSRDPHAELIRERGQAHEAAQLEVLRTEFGEHVDLVGPPTFTREGLEEAHERTRGAMRDGAPLIYQATLFDGTWQGRADFLRRVDRPSDLGDFSYEVIDTKLARQVKPEFVHQLVLYSNLVAGVQGVEPELAHVLLGDKSTFPIRIADYAALHRHVLKTLEGVVGSAGDRDLSGAGRPLRHLRARSECRVGWSQDDHLSLVAGAHRRRRELLDRARDRDGRWACERARRPRSRALGRGAVRASALPGRASGRVARERRADAPLSRARAGCRLRAAARAQPG